MIALTAPQLKTALAIADVLVPETTDRPALRSADPDHEWLARALRARDDMATELTALLDRLTDSNSLDADLRALRDDHRELFDTLAGVVAGAYYMTPIVRDLIGYPGQERRPAPVSLAADELSDEVFDGATAYHGGFRRPPDFDQTIRSIP
ncbi:hypothetical protein [Nocardia sp. BMG51109]|uniref:hypothetical protein n=1 Tax=Nocardia sp. BMG51109 TaxID=1056816 RepID=UPI0004653074|nr:hypothetical protein [Nocardia sp. BMG51109]